MHNKKNISNVNDGHLVPVFFPKIEVHLDPERSFVIYFGNDDNVDGEKAVYGNNPESQLEKSLCQAMEKYLGTLPVVSRSKIS
jgi:hypothetical protein